MQDKFHKYLFQENNRVYAVLDGASVEDLPMKLYEMQPRNFCLYRGELDADIAEVAPYLIELMPGTTFTNWLLGECWGKHWGIFACSQHSIVEIRKHFRRFLTVYDEAGNPLLFRFYDPRVLIQYLPTCGAEELNSLFGKVTTYFAESGADLLRFDFNENELRQQALSMNEITIGV